MQSVWQQCRHTEVWDACVWMCGCTCIQVSWRPEVDVGNLPHFPAYALKQGFSVKLIVYWCGSSHHASEFWGWDDRGAATPTRHLCGFWGSSLSFLCLYHKHFKRWAILQLPPRHTSRTFELAHPNIYPIWSTSFRTTAAVSPWLRATAEYMRGTLVGVQYCWCVCQNITQRIFVSKAVWTKGSTVSHTTAPEATKTDKEVIGGKDRSDCVCVFSFCCFVVLF